MTAAWERIRDVLAGWPIGSGYYQDRVSTDDAGEMADALMAEVEKLAAERAAEELRAAVAREQAIHGALSGNVSLFADRLRARAAALAPEEGR